MTKLSLARLATLKRNAGMSRFVDRPRPGPRVDRKWCMTVCGDCVILYHPESDEWVMRVSGRKIDHRIPGDSGPAQINAQWRSFCKTHNA